MAANVQKAAPDFRRNAVVDGQFKELSLADFRGKWLGIVFYPLDFTFVCPTELIAFSDRVGEFREQGAEIVGVSVDSVYSHLAWSEMPRKAGGIAGIQIPLVADLDKTMSRDYGVLLEDGIALRGFFLIDPEGILRHITINDLPIGRSVDEALRVLKAARFVAEHGEVCPADWKEGEATIVPDPKGAQKFFEKTDKAA